MRSMIEDLFKLYSYIFTDIGAMGSMLAVVIFLIVGAFGFARNTVPGDLLFPIKKIAEQRGFMASIEEVVENGRIDVSLVKDSIKIACEIAVSNSVDYELKNILKCLNTGYSLICVISKNEKHLEKIKEKAEAEIKNQAEIRYFNPDQVTDFLDSFTQSEEKEVKRIRGYRVKVNYRAVDPV